MATSRRGRLYHSALSPNLLANLLVAAENLLWNNQRHDFLAQPRPGSEQISLAQSSLLEYTPSVFNVEQHVRGKWACRQCETLIQAPVPAQVIDKGIPTAGLLAHVMVAKFADHLPLYRQAKIFGRAGLEIARSILAQWVGQTGVRLRPLVDALREAVLSQGVIHPDAPRANACAGREENPP